MSPTELSEPVTVQMRLPVDVLERMRAEAERDLISFPLLVRRSCLREYGRGAVLPDEGTNSTEQVQKIPETTAVGNG